jgi:hypothetical protein
VKVLAVLLVLPVVVDQAVAQEPLQTVVMVVLVVYMVVVAELQMVELVD